MDEEAIFAVEEFTLNVALSPSASISAIAEGVPVACVVFSDVPPPMALMRSMADLDVSVFVFLLILIVVDAVEVGIGVGGGGGGCGVKYGVG